MLRLLWLSAGIYHEPRQKAIDVLIGLIVAQIDNGWSRLNGTTPEARRWTSLGASW